MRTGELKSLLTILRAHEVSEFSDVKRGVSVKLGVAVAPVASKAKPVADTQSLQEQILSSKRAQEALKNLGVDAGAAAEVLVDVS